MNNIKMVVVVMVELQILEFSNSANLNKHLMPIIVDSPPFLFTLLFLIIFSFFFIFIL